MNLGALAACPRAAVRNAGRAVSVWTQPSGPLPPDVQCLRGRASRPTRIEGRKVPDPRPVAPVFGPAYVVPRLTDQMCIEVAPPLVVLLTSGNVIDLTVLFGSTGTVVAYT